MDSAQVHIHTREECVTDFWKLAAALVVRYGLLNAPEDQADSINESRGGAGSQSG
ncbi:hypothetical protein ACIQU5_29400 [Streptomyces sp. NPDC090306]|uniref:hypothetical protein n=1 Tax=Streptomyces sp. NPDC090306 TaxID=3365961 RepID=UPI00380037CA